MARRSIPLAALAPILRAGEFADFFSLQYPPEAARDICRLEEDTGIRIRHLAGKVQCDNYDTTASFVAGLDLVITVGTSMHHLANAIGVPTWTLVPIACGWRYAERGTLWYRETARFFRQHAADDWSGAVADVAEALRRRYGKAEIAA